MPSQPCGPGCRAREPGSPQLCRAGRRMTQPQDIALSHAQGCPGRHLPAARPHPALPNRAALRVSGCLRRARKIGLHGVRKGRGVSITSSRAAVRYPPPASKNNRLPAPIPGQPCMRAGPRGPPCRGDRAGLGERGGEGRPPGSRLPHTEPDAPPPPITPLHRMPQADEATEGLIRFPARCAHRNGWMDRRTSGSAVPVPPGGG